MPKLSIIIPNFQNPPLLRLCLKTLSQNIPATLDYEVIVTDGKSSPETQYVVTQEFAKNFASLQLVPFAANVGYTKLVNAGLAKSKGDYMLIINADVIVLKDSIPQMLAYMEKHPGVGLLGPQLLNFDDSIQASCFRFLSPVTVLYRRISHLPFAHKILNHFLLQDQDLSKPQSVDWLMGSALLARRSSLERVGLMDEVMFLYMSEVDWARRFWENNSTVVYYPPAQFYHYHKRESKGRFGVLDVIFKQETRWHIRDAWRYFSKHGFFNQARPQTQQAMI